MRAPVGICSVVEMYLFSSAVVMAKHRPIANISDSDIGTTAANPLNVLVLGAANVGKSTLCSNGSNGKSTLYTLRNDKAVGYRHTVDMATADGQLRRLHLVLYDYQPNVLYRYPSTNIATPKLDITLRKMHAVMIVVDASSEKSYQWIEDNALPDRLCYPMGLDGAHPSKLPIILVANKIDSIDENIRFGREFDDRGHREPPLKKFSDMAESERLMGLTWILREYVHYYDMPYVEVSAQCTVNVEQLLEITAKECLVFHSQRFTNRNVIGQRLFRTVCAVKPLLAGRIMDMLLMLDTDELLTLQSEPKALLNAINDAVVVCKNYFGGLQNIPSARVPRMRDDASYFDLRTD